MNSSRVKILLVIWALSLVCSLSASSGEWKTFHSERFGYSVRYPASWYLFETSLTGKLESLDILNFPTSQRVEGVILKEGGAEISISVPERQVATINQWKKKQTASDEEVTEHELKVTNPSPFGCVRLVEVTSLLEVGPGRKYSQTTYYCQTSRGLYGIFLTNWQGDPQENRLRAVALNIAESLQATKPTPKPN